MQRTMDFRYKPIYWYLEAEKTRSLAESMASMPECRERLLRVADEYEQIGQALERLLRDLLESHRHDAGSNVTSFRPTG